MNREKLIYSAVKVLNEDFHAPLERVAEVAQISKRTLYRYFKDRDSLITACYVDMLETWYIAMVTAFKSDTDPVKQLEAMLYAAIDSGVKYIFLHALEERQVDVAAMDKEKVIAYEQAKEKWFAIVPQLQAKHIIDNRLSSAWIRHLFASVARASVKALNSGDVAPNDLKKFAWLSFSRSIGIVES
ncbi:TetR/AcrR family transcriptional regulator [Sphingobacterium sp. G1-14]|uniref:TetR/AcrR family transcriptional regulator n=1 Tax=Sphingobacterium TaxID=28453 RepID=UPI000B493CD8|nr:TetR/AcrR family transcriptional regulator [Sphingobacterium sp. G1-14]